MAHFLASRGCLFHHEVTKGTKGHEKDELAAGLLREARFGAESNGIFVSSLCS